jgi:hypothetical protein
MDRKLLWELFEDTGSPEVYILYKNASESGPATV